MVLEIKDIMKALPHRYPFLLCDRILEVEYGKAVKGIKNVTINEPFFQGHFPDEPIMPGVLILESMAQVGGFIFYKSDEIEKSLKGKIVKINEAKFLRTVLPGDVLEVTGKLVERSGNYSQVDLFAKVGGRVVAKAMITYAFNI
ncbi:3-hydroxyacyl-[acyl-carrier-protein] dehydratase FabZ [Clostridium zeae]|uniref:3-hydroxyacyl-[acyl-carrier-protein] dehydratase FabZ n=1 Tax=Clostridium zeae TaxID=2759022 RepID=A0ABQ1E873_9CLOT|nr:3-hydroxyacyl-ACP dehydratase FabZ [Clostridium zeae]GFZ30876.1 3-hydroxyacyl-[acyl-carrier-protein] dehydratase FabZ [Clostridium zeae]